MRDVPIHTYFGVNLRRVWKVVKEDVPELKLKILKILEEVGDQMEKPKEFPIKSMEQKLRG